ncbi:hypothetical protein WN48_09529 [Eufriesea mexicana]|nr:hypothetical protein WN48_09529 [Eufriesea mexicana]
MHHPHSSDYSETTWSKLLMLAKPFRRAHDSREEIRGMSGKKKAGETRAAFRPDSSGNGDS